MRLHRWIVILAAWMVPKAFRPDWRAEWEAELDHREARLREWPRAGQRLPWDLLRRSAGAIWDALWLQSSQWYSLRLFGRHWRLALAALLSLGTALATVVIGFAAYNALLRRPPGVHDPQSLQFIHVRTPSQPFGPASYDEFTFYRDHSGTFSDVAAFPYTISTADFSSGDHSVQVLATLVSDNYFSVLGVSAAAGSLAISASPAAEADRVVISQRLWRRLGREPGPIGSVVRVNGQPVLVSGVAPATFAGVNLMNLIWAPDVWMSFKTAEKVLGSDGSRLTGSRTRWLHMVGRLRTGFNLQQATADVGVLSSDLTRLHPDTNAGISALVTDVTVTPPGDKGWISLLVGGLCVLVLLALIVACANVTNLLLGLATARRHEMLVRAALGASRLQLVAPILRESVVLGLLSGCVGCGLAFLALARLADFSVPIGAFPPVSFNLRPDTVVVCVSLLVALAAGLGVGVLPAWRSASEGLSGALNRETSIGQARKATVRSILVVIQMTVGTLVMVSVGVSIRSLVSLQRLELGFSARHLVYATLDLTHSGYDERTGRLLYQRIRERIGRLPGVEAVALADSGPLAGFARELVLPDGGHASSNDPGAETMYAVVDEQYFAALGMPLSRGRAFDSRDGANSPDVAVVNASMAAHYWPGIDPVDHWLRLGSGRRVQVVGVAPDSKYEELTEAPVPFMYFAMSQRYVPHLAVIVRSNREHVPGPDAIMRALFGLNPALEGGIMTLDDLRRASLLFPRTIVVTACGFGVLTLSLTMFGLYSTVFYSVRQRQQEMAIRVALGAQSGDIFRTVLRHTASVALAGAALGIAAALALLPLASSMFFGIGTAEPVVMAAAAASSVMLAVTIAYTVAKPWTRMGASDMLRQ